MKSKKQSESKKPPLKNNNHAAKPVAQTRLGKLMAEWQNSGSVSAKGSKKEDSEGAK